MTLTTTIISVSQLNQQIRYLLENDVGEVAVEGEISTLSKPSSGHYYFTLKDKTAQIRCVFFRNRKQSNTETMLNTGQQIVAYGRLSLYEARGDYQLIIDKIEAAGQGDIYRQFELLKVKLAAMGLFESSRKKILPRFPESIGVITSTSGAALHDILTTLSRRYPIAKIFIYPSEVQGATASKQLISAIVKANADSYSQVLILARGGGSFEDLWAFNDEQLALTITQSTIPIVSGIGHETDFTIADFVADFRAATPTAAAEAVSPNQKDLIIFLNDITARMHNALDRVIQHKHLVLEHLLQKIASPKRLIQSYLQTLDYLLERIHFCIRQRTNRAIQKLQLLNTQLQAQNPLIIIQQKKQRISYLEMQLIHFFKSYHAEHQARFEKLVATMHAYSPLATLGRGYAIASINQQILYESSQAHPGDLINLQLAKGKLLCKVVNHVE